MNVKNSFNKSHAVALLDFHISYLHYMLQQYTILKPFFLTSFFFPFLPSCQKKHTNTNRATIAMLGGAEPRPNHKLNKNVSPQRRHLGLSTYEPETLKVPISNSMLYHRQQHEINQPHQQQDHAIYHKQVEQQGFRFHQGQKFAARGQGVYRSAETNNDLRTLLANVPNPKLDQYKFSKRMFVNSPKRFRNSYHRFIRCILP